VRKATKGQERASEVLRGPKIPESMWRRVFAHASRHRAEEIREKSAMRQQAAKHLSRIEQPIAGTAGGDPEVQRALSGLRAITDRVAKRKLVAPRSAKVLPGILAGTYALRFTPPYAQSSGSETPDPGGDPTLSASSVPNLGQYNVGVATDPNSRSGGGCNYWFGVSFTSLFEPATVRVQLDAQIAFSWWVNSIGPSASSIGEVLVLITQFGNGVIAQNDAFAAYWNQVAYRELNFDFGSMTVPVSVEAQLSNASYPVFVLVNVVAGAQAAGWPGSLAGANLAVTVPSITVEVTKNPLETAI
jgi:hypothetical protein